MLEIRGIPKKWDLFICHKEEKIINKNQMINMINFKIKYYYIENEFLI